MKKPIIKNIIKNFNEDGYVIVKNFLSKNECGKFLKIISKYANKTYAPIMNPDRIEFLISQSTEVINKKKFLGQKADFIKSMKKDCAYFRSLMIKKEIIDLLSKIKKKKINPLMSQMIFKKASSKFSKQSWQPHQDNSYPKNKNGHYITTNIFFNNSNKKNGTLYVWPKSHKYGIFNHFKKVSYREKDGKPGNVVKTFKNFEVKDLNFSKGDLLILHGNCVHGSYPNRSKKSRPLYSVSYLPRNEKFIPGKNAQRKVISINK